MQKLGMNGVTLIVVVSDDTAANSKCGYFLPAKTALLTYSPNPRQGKGFQEKTTQTAHLSLYISFFYYLPL